jgi:hypothetical protein
MGVGSLKGGGEARGWFLRRGCGPAAQGVIFTPLGRPPGRHGGIRKTPIQACSAFRRSFGKIWKLGRADALSSGGGVIVLK